jgi:hypothetical protein
VPWEVTVFAWTTAPSRTLPVSPTPPPSPSARANVPIVLSTDVSSFDISGIVDGDELRTAWGYRARLRIRGVSEDVLLGDPVVLENVTLSVGWTYISANAAILVFAAESARGDSAVVDIKFGSAGPLWQYDPERAAVSAIPGRRGFAVHAPGQILTFITAGYPFVTNVSTFWFGNSSGLYTDEPWSQVVDDAFDGFDSALAFTWQGINVPADGEVRKTVIVRFGQFESSRVTLSLEPLTGTFYFKSSVPVRGLANAEPLPTGFGIRLLVVVDGKEGEPVPVDRNSYWVGSPFTVSVVPEELGLFEGTYRLAFYAVDEDGDVLDAVVETLTVSTTEITPTEGPAAGQASASVAGPVVGSIVGVLAVAGAVGAFIWWRKNRIGPETKEFMIDGKQDL